MDSPVERLRGLLAKATKGPWAPIAITCSLTGGPTGDQRIIGVGDFSVNKDAFALIVAAVNALPDLLTALEAKDVLILRMREALEAVSAQGSRDISDARAALEMLRIARKALSSLEK